MKKITLLGVIAGVIGYIVHLVYREGVKYPMNADKYSDGSKYRGMFTGGKS